MQPDEPNKNGQKTDKEQQEQDLDMHSSKDHHESQGGQGGRSSDNDTNSEHDKGNEHSIAGREDS